MTSPMLLRDPSKAQKEDHTAAAVTMLSAYVKTGDFGYLSQAREHIGWLYNFHLRSVNNG